MKEVAGQIGAAINKLTAAMGMIATDDTQSFKQATLDSMQALKALAERSAQFSIPMAPLAAARQTTTQQPATPGPSGTSS